MAGQCANLAALANNARAGSTVPSIGVGALDRPHGGYVCCNQQRLRDLSAVHEPDRYVAAGVIPEKVALTIAVEVPGADSRPDGGVGPSDRQRLRDLGAVHEPDSHVAVGVAPKNVALAV